MHPRPFCGLVGPGHRGAQRSPLRLSRHGGDFELRSLDFAGKVADS